MQPIFEAKYLAIKWKDKNTVSDIIESINPIKIEVENVTSYKMEIQTYKRIEDGSDGQIAFHFLNEENDIQPYFVKANNEKIYLIKIKDSRNKKEWWIEDGVWSKKYNCRLSELWNHVGETSICFDNIICRINIRAITFTKEQLKTYLESFKNDFRYLILEKNSLTNAEIKNSNNNRCKELNGKNLKYLKIFAENISKILNNPKKELKETQSLKDIKKTKPIAKTFMEIASNGYKKKLTSRDVVESFNVAENKYIHFILSQVYLIVLNINKISLHREVFYKEEEEGVGNRLSEFKNLGNFKRVNEEILQNDIDDLKRKIDKDNIKYKNIIEQCISNQNPELEKQLKIEITQPKIEDIINEAIAKQIKSNDINIEKFHIKLISKQKEYYSNISQFWGEIKIKDEWYKFENPKDSLSLEFNKDIFGNIFKENSEYVIEAHVEKDKRERKDKNGSIYKRYFKYIQNIELLNSTNKVYDISYQTLFVKLDKKQEDFNNKIQFKGKIKSNINDNWFEFKNKNNSFILEFDKDKFEDILKEYSEYKITAFIGKLEYKWEKDEKKGIIHKRYFKYITSLEQISLSYEEVQLKKYKKMKEILPYQDWKIPLNRKEKLEREREISFLEKQTKDLANKLNINSKHFEEIESILKILFCNLKKIEKLSISKDSYFPNSMTFVQNQNYQAAHIYYNHIKNMIEINADFFTKIEKIGIHDLPTLYERWCLLQIIKVLMDSFHFIPEDNWKQKLLAQMLNEKYELKDEKKRRNVSIKFINKNIEKIIVLWYEKELRGENSQRPDFVLDIESTKTKNKHRLVMDAKFHEDVNIKCLINTLYPSLDIDNITDLDKKCSKPNDKIDKKNYSENNNNTVFIVHPDTNKSIKKRKNPSNWGTDAYYGETDMFDYEWDKDYYPNHKYGSILLSPINKNRYGSFLDNLQRLIGMIMQYTMEDNKNIRLFSDLETKYTIANPEAKEKEFCIKCGSHDINQKSSGISKSKRGYYYEKECSECKHSFVYFYCWNCGCRLIKNGSYWSYHAAQTLDEFDIKCPQCNKFWFEKGRGDI